MLAELFSFALIVSIYFSFSKVLLKRKRNFLFFWQIESFAEWTTIDASITGKTGRSRSLATRSRSKNGATDEFTRLVAERSSSKTPKTNRIDFLYFRFTIWTRKSQRHDKIVWKIVKKKIYDGKTTKTSTTFSFSIRFRFRLEKTKSNVFVVITAKCNDRSLHLHRWRNRSLSKTLIT